MRSCKKKLSFRKMDISTHKVNFFFVLKLCIFNLVNFQSVWMFFTRKNRVLHNSELFIFDRLVNNL